MKISTRGRYAIRILLDVAMHQDQGAVAMKDVARRQQISKKYGDQIGMQLSQAGLLLAIRGRQGGYRLIPAAKDVSVLQVLRSMEGSMVPVQCPPAFVIMELFSFNEKIRSGILFSRHMTEAVESMTCSPLSTSS